MSTSYQRLTHEEREVISRCLYAGDKVSFDTEDSDKGPRAVNVQKA